MAVEVVVGGVIEGGRGEQEDCSTKSFEDPSSSLRSPRVAQPRGLEFW